MLHKKNIFDLNWIEIYGDSSISNAKNFMKNVNLIANSAANHQNVNGL